MNDSYIDFAILRRYLGRLVKSTKELIAQIGDMAGQTGNIFSIKSVIFYVDPNSVASMSLLGREIIRFSPTIEHSLLIVFRKKLKDFVGLKAEARSSNSFVWKKEKKEVRCFPETGTSQGN